MVEEIVNPTPKQPHTLRLVIASTLGVLLFIACVTSAFYFGQKEQATAQAENNSSVQTLQKVPFYSPPLSKETLSQVSATALPSLNTLIEGNMLPFEPAKESQARYEANMADVKVLNGPKIAIVIDDMGVNVSESQRVLDELPKEVTLAFLPYGNGSMKQADFAHKRGQEIMVHIPMEARTNAEGYTPNPGENALYVELAEDELYKRTVENITPFLSIAVGANNHMGSKMTSSEKAMRPALRAISDHKLFFLDSLTTAQSRVKAAAKDLPLPLLTRDVFLDHYQDSVRINQALEDTLKQAQQNGSAIAIGHPYPETTAAIAAWVKTLPAGVQLVPITTLLKE